MAHFGGAAPSRVFYGWWVAAAFSLVISLSLFLFDLSGGYGLAFGVSCALLVVGAGLSLTIDVAGRPRMRRPLQPVTEGR